MKIMDEVISHEYDPTKWSVAYGFTVKDLMNLLVNYPQDAVVHICGIREFSIHTTNDQKSISFDCESLSELEEYEDKTPIHLIHLNSIG